MKSKGAVDVEIKKCFKDGKWQKEQCSYIYEMVTLVERDYSYKMDLMFARASKRVCVGFMVLGRFGK